ncbi:MAG: TetR/AcrR family transcriptional regulator [Vulcanimicrobiaceae bacterium]
MERAAALFNTRGVAGASMADVSLATGLEKGGVYNHFETKEALALAAFDYAAGLVLQRLDAAVAAAPTALGRLHALVDVYRSVADKPFIAGGCPLMNTAVEADDTHPVLRERARKAMERWRALIVCTVDEAVAGGELEPVDSAALASTVIATLEGAVMLSKLYRDPAHMHFAVEHLARHLDGLAHARRGRG